MSRERVRPCVVNASISEGNFKIKQKKIKDERMDHADKIGL